MRTRLAMTAAAARAIMGCEISTLRQSAAVEVSDLITRQPAGRKVYMVGQTAEPLEVKTAGGGDLSYQWYVDVPGEDGSLSRNPIEGAAEAAYTPATTETGSFIYDSDTYASPHIPLLSCLCGLYSPLVDLNQSPLCHLRRGGGRRFFELLGEAAG
jgi:hypothetical protein